MSRLLTPRLLPAISPRTVRVCEREDHDVLACDLLPNPETKAIEYHHSPCLVGRATAVPRKGIEGSGRRGAYGGALQCFHCPRCLRCSRLLRVVPKDRVEHLLLRRTRDYYDDFSRLRSLTVYDSDHGVMVGGAVVASLRSHVRVADGACPDDGE